MTQVFLPLAAGVEELELGVGDAAVVGVHLGRFGAVAVADELDEALAGVDLLAQPLSQLAVAGGEVVLGDRVESERAHGGGDGLPSGEQLLADGGEEKARAVHAASASKVHSFPCQRASIKVVGTPFPSRLMILLAIRIRLPLRSGVAPTVLVRLFVLSSGTAE